MSRGSTLRVHGLDVSYYTGKLEAYLRAKGLAYELVEMDTRAFQRCARITGVAQMPQLELPDGHWLTDSTRIIEHFERETPDVAIYPGDPAVCFIADLLEDFGDEWLWRPAMYYRWAFQADALLLSDRLARGMLRDVPLPLAARRWLIRQRQRTRFLKNDGVSATTSPVIESIYLDTLDALQAVLGSRSFLLGGRPTQADMGFFGALFRHFASDPTPSRIMRQQAPAVMEWVARLWNLQPAKFVRRNMPQTLLPGLERLLGMVCEDYLPYLHSNQGAFEAGGSRVTWLCRGVEFSVPVNPYRAWCWQQLRAKYLGLANESREQVSAWLLYSSVSHGSAAVELLKRLPDNAVSMPIPIFGRGIARIAKPVDSHWCSS